jgi:hypothetical protein
MHKLNMKHEKHPWFIRDSNPVSLGQKSGALTTELPGHIQINPALKISGIFAIPTVHYRQAFKDFEKDSDKGGYTLLKKIDFSSRMTPS